MARISTATSLAEPRSCEKQKGAREQAQWAAQACHAEVLSTGGGSLEHCGERPPAQRQKQLLLATSASKAPPVGVQFGAKPGST